MRILLIEDDANLNRTMKKQLQAEGYSVDSCLDGEEAYYYGERNSYDLIILDRMLPHMDGLTVLTKLRKQQIMVPVIMVTALSSLDDRIDGLDAGADDYLAKPFAMSELSARIRALLRRPVPLRTEPLLIYAEMTLDPIKKTLSYHSTQCELSKKEFELLEFLFRNKEQTLSRELILSRVWGPDSIVGDGNLDNYISFLRRRLRTLGCSAKITTIHGIGYRLEGL